MCAPLISQDILYLDDTLDEEFRGEGSDETVNEYVDEAEAEDSEDKTKDDTESEVKNEEEAIDTVEATESEDKNENDAIHNAEANDFDEKGDENDDSQISKLAVERDDNNKKDDSSPYDKITEKENDHHQAEVKEQHGTKDKPEFTGDIPDAHDIANEPHKVLGAKAYDDSDLKNKEETDTDDVSADFHARIASAGNASVVNI